MSISYSEYLTEQIDMSGNVQYYLPDEIKEKHPLYKGFKLIRNYPGSRREVGDFEPYTSGEFLKYPEIWEPVYHDDVSRDLKIDDILKD